MAGMEERKDGLEQKSGRSWVINITVACNELNKIASEKFGWSPDTTMKEFVRVGAISIGALADGADSVVISKIGGKINIESVTKLPEPDVPETP